MSDGAALPVLATAADLDWIKALADRYRPEVGFVRRAALAAALARGELLVLPPQRGWVQFHRRRDGWHTIYELIGTGGGSGRALLQAVPRPRRLKCPVGLAANGFYAHLGGTLHAVEPGRRRPLNVWVWDAETNGSARDDA